MRDHATPMTSPPTSPFAPVFTQANADAVTPGSLVFDELRVGLSYADVAAALDLSPGSVGTTVRRAESVLREELTRHASSD